MSAIRSWLLVSLFLAPLPSVLEAEAEGLPAKLVEELTFEVPHAGGTPRGWQGGPPETIGLDDEVVHGGEWAVRLERNPESPGDFTSLTRSVPIAFSGETVELRGFLRTENVTRQAGLWMRQDADGTSVAFDNMSSTGLVGTTEWTAYRIQLKLVPEADTLYFGALLGGDGKVWIDDLELLVDGKPMAQAPYREVPKTVLATDQEFDDGSKISAEALTPMQVESLVLLGKIWGFLKYHHPRITGGELHWDYELFRVMPAILEAKGRAQALEELLAWGHRIGTPESCDPCAEPSDDELHLAAPTSWIRDEAALGPGLAAYLQTVERHRFAGEKQFYVSLHRGVRNPKLSHEPAYAHLEKPDAGYRILGLLRFWNIIEYWFPYRNVIGEDWDGVLREMLPVFAGAAEEGAYDRALLRLAARVHDTHVNFWQQDAVKPPVGDCELPVAIRFLGERPVVAQLPDPSGSEASAGLDALLPGDVITAIDGRPIDALIAEWSPFHPASNRPTRLARIASSMTRGSCSEMRLDLRRGGESLQINQVRQPRQGAPSRELWRRDRPGPAFQRLSEEVAYLKLSNVKAADVDRYLEQAAGSRGWILDIRNYPKEFMVFALGRRLVEEKVPFARFTRGDPANPGTFLWTEPLYLEPQTPRYEGKILILVDETSISQSEYTAMAFRAAPNALVVGSATAGADGNVSPFTVPGGARTVISGIGVFYPDKTPTQRVGILPDIEVTPTVEGLREGRDEVLERAVREILGPDADEQRVRRLASWDSP